MALNRPMMTQTVQFLIQALTLLPLGLKTGLLVYDKYM